MVVKVRQKGCRLGASQGDQVVKIFAISVQTLFIEEPYVEGEVPSALCQKEKERVF